MLEIVFGEGVGSGKSYYVTARRVIPHLVKGGTVYHSDTYKVYFEPLKKHIADTYGYEIEADQIHSFPESDVPRLNEVTPMGTAELPVLVIVDEAQGELPCISGTYKKGSEEERFFQWLCQSRHDDTDVIFITQEINNIAKKIQRLVTYVVVVRNMVNFKVGGLRWPLRQFRVQWKDRNMKVVQQVEWLWHSTTLFGCYESKACRGRHTRIAEMPVPRKNLKRVKRKLSMKMILILGLFFVMLAGYSWKARAEKHEKIAPVVSASVPGRKEDIAATSAAVPAAAPKKPAFEIRTESLRYSNGRDEIRTAQGHYIVGEYCYLGRVEKIQGRTALVRTPAKDLVAIVAIEEAVQSSQAAKPGEKSGAVDLVPPPSAVKPAVGAEYKLTAAERARGGYPAQ